MLPGMTEEFLLHNALVSSPSAGASGPDRWMLVLHGIFGAGGNWRTFARRVCEARPDWGVILPDLRAHGLSQDPPPPHTLAAAAEDLARMQARLGLAVRAVLGHSFGAKVALWFTRGLAPPPPDVLFVLDADPGSRPGAAEDAEAHRVLDLLRSIPEPLPSRERFVELVQARGHARAVAEWLAMNVRRDHDGGFRLRMDLAALSSLLDDHFAQDLWPALEDPASAARVHVILGGRSDIVGPEARARLEALAARDARISLDVLPKAGHWLHVDDPDGLLALVLQAL